MSDEPLGNCIQCGVELKSQSDIGMEYCMGGPEITRYCNACNELSGDFIFRRTLQVMAEAERKENEGDKTNE